MKQEKPIITPEEKLAVQGIDATQFPMKKALLAFLTMRGMQEKFKGQTIPELSSTFMGKLCHCWLRENGEFLVGPILSGPLCSVILEELSVFGVKYAIGYGLCGSLDPDVPLGSIMVAESSFCSDGTSKEYTNDSEVFADADMLHSLERIIRGHGIQPEVDKVWTTDAYYRELPSKIAYWKGKGAKFVNLETASFYAVARSKGIKAAYLSVVSDNVNGDKWSGLNTNSSEATKIRQNTCLMQNICLEMIEAL